MNNNTECTYPVTEHCKLFAVNNVLIHVCLVVVQQDHTNNH